jgi:NAD(P)-dependent dehydrogenase (short-subunit alcohol dehydrogenase family)
MRTAIVTGASRGLGRALAEALAERGWRLVLDARGAEALEAVRAALAERTEVVAVPGDVSDDAHRAALVEACGGELDALVNNAGILGPSPLPAVADVSLPAVTEILRVNTVAPLALIQAALPLLADGGRIVNVSSDAAVAAYPGWGPYGAAKAALEQLTRVLAAERPDVRTYVFDPGDMRTQMHQDAYPGEDISDRPPPEHSVPGLLRLLEEDLPSGRYTAGDGA